MKNVNYKKLVLIAVAGASIALAGCGNSAKNMSFEDTYTAFRESHTSKAVQMFTNLSKAPGLHEKGNYQLSGSVSGGISLNLAIDAESRVANEELNTDSTLNIKGEANQPGLDDKISLDAAILFKMVAGQSYINLSKLSLSSEKGNPQISMIGAFSSVLTNKWISLASSGMDTSAALKGLSLSKLYALPAVATQSIKDHPIFRETSKETVDGNTVYHIALDATGLYMVAKDVVNNEVIQTYLQGETFTDKELMDRAVEFVANSAFKGTMTAYSKKNVVLAISNINLDETQAVKGTVEDDTAHFDVVDLAPNGSGILASLDLTEKGDETVLSLSAPSQSFVMQASVDMNKATADHIAYLLTIVLSHPSFAFDLRGDINIEKAAVTPVEAPSSFQTIDQLLGGFSSIIGSGAAGIADMSQSMK